RCPPVRAPMPRGISATCPARLAGGAPTTPAVRAVLADAYAGEPFVHVLPEERWPTTAATAGSNAVHLQAAAAPPPAVSTPGRLRAPADAHAGRAVVVAALDNLGKGAAGQAVQAANLMLGLPETAGLTAQGVAPGRVCPPRGGASAPPGAAGMTCWLAHPWRGAPRGRP